MKHARRQPSPARPVTISVQADVYRRSDGRFDALVRSLSPPGSVLYDVTVAGPYLSPVERRDLAWGAHTAQFDADAAALLIERAIAEEAK